MKIKNNYFYYATILSVFMLLKHIYTLTDNSDLKFLLVPTNALVKLVTGSVPAYTDQRGFYYGNLAIVIEKSCSGYNFWIICFVMLSCSSLPFFSSHSAKIATVAAMLPACWLLTVFANASRILTALLVKGMFPGSSRQFPWLHQAEGIFIYLSLLITFYTTAHYLFTKTTYKNAKPA